MSCLDCLRSRNIHPSNDDALGNPSTGAGRARRCRGSGSSSLVRRHAPAPVFRSHDEGGSSVRFLPHRTSKAAMLIPDVVKMEAGHASRRLAQSNGRRRLQRDAHPCRQHRHRKCLVRAGCPCVPATYSLNRNLQGNFARPSTLPEPELFPARAFPEQREDGAAKGRHGPRGRRVRIRPAQVPWYVQKLACTELD